MSQEIPIDQSFMDACKDIPDVAGGHAAGLPPVEQAGAAAPSVLPSSMLTQETLETTFEMLFNAAAEFSGEGGEFWQLKPRENANLAKAWLPVVGPLLDRMGESQTFAIFAAGTMTFMTIGPRVKKERIKRASKKTAATETAPSTDSPSSSDLLGLGSLRKPIV